MLAKYIHDANADYRRIRQRVPLGPLRTEQEYRRAIGVLDDLVDEIGEQETHPLADLAETVALAVEAYEERHVRIPAASGLAILRSLMKEHGLTQADLGEIGSQGVVSEVLSGKRDLNVRQIARLADRFGLSPTLFIPTSAKKHSCSSTRQRRAKVG